MRKQKSLDERNAILERKIGKGIKQLQSQGKQVPFIKDGRNNAEVVKVRPSFGQIMANFLVGNSQAGHKNASTVHTRIPGHKSKKFKGFDRENRRYNSFKSKIR